ncbi:hypothetical protein K503DRAFT_54826 [Rhizopogon vinicolor AM-OR11-026]|uniref:DUF6533 domain-containing protein n=1 Tax=Rhizopogon vinicolor AM-OR11-026 TaxID=1314800 RepID=A0A1B7MGK1_9AGAM|nr:hypothetical protein K503DRAFT_54826 [Rhizopogon vinicolor AM-OR11-026]
MPFVSDDPTWWPTISLYREFSYFQAASLIVVVYDWVLTFGQEFELIWRQRWSIMSVLYLSIRYLAIPYIILSMLAYPPSISVTDKG